jgi:hypothetical protein
MFAHAVQNEKMGEAPISETSLNTDAIKCPVNKKPLIRGSAKTGCGSRI